MVLYDAILSGFFAWCDELWWLSLTPSRKEKLRGDTSLANRKVRLRVVSVQNASTIRSSIRRTSSRGSIRCASDATPSPPLSLLLNTIAGRARLGGGVSLSGFVGGRQPS